MVDSGQNPGQFFNLAGAGAGIKMLSRHQTGDRRPGSRPQNPGQFVKCGRGRGRDENAIPAPDRGPAPGSRSATGNRYQPKFHRNGYRSGLEPDFRSGPKINPINKFII